MAAPRVKQRRRGSRQIGTYLYCLVRSAAAPSVPAGLRGLPGTGRARCLDAGAGLWLVVADAPLDRYGGPAIEQALRSLPWVARCAVAHEGLVEEMARFGTTIPIKIFTIFADDARALAHIRTLRSGVDRALERVAGRQEWGVRLRFDGARALSRVAAQTRGQSTRATSGTAFLLVKKRQRDTVQEIRRGAPEEVERVLTELGAFADDTRRRPRSRDELAGDLLLDAVFLVPVDRVASFRSHARKLGSRLSPRGYDLELSGPWPAYNFVGVS